MKKLICLSLACVICFTMAACDLGGEEKNPTIQNPPQSEQLSYETDKDGYITSCTISVGGSTYSYQCPAGRYLMVADDYSVIMEYRPDDMTWEGKQLKQIRFYDGTAKVLSIHHLRDDNERESFCERIELFNIAGDKILEKTPRPDVEEYSFGLYCDFWMPPALTADGQQQLDENGNGLMDPNAFAIYDTCMQNIENGVVIMGNLMSTTYYDLQTGTVIYSRIYDPLNFGYEICVYDRTAFTLTYKEILGEETLTKCWYNADGSYSQKVTDLYEREILSEGIYSADGTKIG